MKINVLFILGLFLLWIIFGAIILLESPSNTTENKELIQPQRDITHMSCNRTYILVPQRDAIKCTECSIQISDGSKIHKEGC